MVDITASHTDRAENLAVVAGSDEDWCLLVSVGGGMRAVDGDGQLLQAGPRKILLRADLPDRRLNPRRLGEAHGRLGARRRRRRRAGRLELPLRRGADQGDRGGVDGRVFFFKQKTAYEIVM